MEKHIEILMSRYNLSKDALLKELSPEYDITQYKNHDYIEVTIHGNTYQIDEKLVNLFKLINKYDMNTYSSCQHNYFGYAGFSFTHDGYVRFVNKILEKVLEKYKYNHDDDDLWNINIMQRFRFNNLCDQPFNKQKIYASCELYEGDTEYKLIVLYHFNQSEIPIIEKELNDIFD